MSSPLLVSSTMAIALTVAIIVNLFVVANVTITNAQQQQMASQPATIQNGTATPFQSTRDSFRVQVPAGWVIHNVKNIGFTLLAEVLQGYGILAQLCPEEQQQQQAALPNVGSSRCEREEVIHIIRYPNLGARLGFTSDDIFTIINRDTIPNAILSYHMQKLQEVGYRDIQIINSTDTTINVVSRSTENNAIVTTVPAKLVEMTYSTNFAPNEIRRGYFVLTVTAATPRNLGDITGYSIFYEGNSFAATETTTPSGSLVLTSLPAPARQVFDSFELVAAPTEPLTVEITSSDTEGIAPATFEFEADVTGGMEPYTINWDFDDGSEGEESDVDDETIDHTFDEAGNYTVTATVIDSSGQTASDSIEITVEEAPPLTAVDIISNDTEGIVPATFEFEANVTGGTEPYTYSWNFGDGSGESNEQTVSHTFDEAGTYNVGVIVIDSTGRTASDSIVIIVEEPPATEEEPVCDPSYPTVCIPPPPPNLNCNDISARNFEALPPDPHEFDADNDGIACESGSNQPNSDNNSGSDDLLFDLDDFLDDLFDRLGLR
jgi:PKD repeat protein